MLFKQSHARLHYVKVFFLFQFWKRKQSFSLFFLLFNNKIRSVHLVSPCLIAVKILLMSADSELLERKNRTKQKPHHTQFPSVFSFTGAMWCQREQILNMATYQSQESCLNKFVSNRKQTEWFSIILKSESCILRIPKITNWSWIWAQQVP